MKLSLLSPQPFNFNFHHSSSLTLFTSSASTPSRRPRWPRMESTSFHHHHRRKDKVVVIVGATGSGKSRLSVDLASLFFPFSEIINSDKMQVYTGLDITTNKIPLNQRRGVPHHLLGDVDPSDGDFSPSDFRRRASGIIADIKSRRNLPVVVGGSNSFIHALLVERFDPELNVFDESLPSSFISSELRYECCFLWVDISFRVLKEYLVKRVDDMFESGMVDELAQFFDPDAGDLELDSAQRTGLRKAIGVPEFDRFFKKYPPGRREWEEERNDHLREGAYEEAVREIKENTCQLAEGQIGKILRLRSAGWDLRRLDATAAFRELLASGRDGSEGGERWAGIWERDVLEPSVKIVKRFLME